MALAARYSSVALSQSQSSSSSRSDKTPTVWPDRRRCLVRSFIFCFCCGSLAPAPPPPLQAAASTQSSQVCSLRIPSFRRLSPLFRLRVYADDDARSMSANRGREKTPSAWLGDGVCLRACKISPPVCLCVREKKVLRIASGDRLYPKGSRNRDTRVYDRVRIVSLVRSFKVLLVFRPSAKYPSSYFLGYDATFRETVNNRKIGFSNVFERHLNLPSSKELINIVPPIKKTTFFWVLFITSKLNCSPREFNKRIRFRLVSFNNKSPDNDRLRVATKRNKRVQSFVTKVRDDDGPSRSPWPPRASRNTAAGTENKQPKKFVRVSPARNTHLPRRAPSRLRKARASLRRYAIRPVSGGGSPTDRFDTLFGFSFFFFNAREPYVTSPAPR